MDDKNNNHNDDQRSQSESNMSTSEWRDRVAAIQRTQMSPVVYNSLVARADRQKRAARAHKTASFLERCNTLTGKAQEANLTRTVLLSSNASVPLSPLASLADFELSPLPPFSPQDQLRHEFEQMATKTSSQSAALKSVLAARQLRTPQRVLHAKRKENHDQQEEIEETVQEKEAEDVLEAMRIEEQQVTLDAFEQEIARDEHEARLLSPHVAPNGHFTPPAPLGFAALLDSLAVEPTDPAELVAKFALYESFLETVVAIREQTIDFWTANRDQFDGAALAAGDQAIRVIDNPVSMGIFDESQQWFVYLMMKKAHENQTSIACTLAAIRAKLDLLAQDDLDCPFCLDPIARESMKVLTCFHKTCSDCWAHWEDLKGRQAFCPLCRHEEFVQDIVVG
jgi:hypothetical protein